MSEPTSDATDATAAIAGRLSAARRNLGWTLTRAAAEVNVSAAHLSRIETGRRQPSIGLLIQLSRAYQLSVGQLVGEEPRAASHVIRRDDVQIHESPEGSYGALSGNIGNHLLEALRVDLAPRASTSKGSRHPGEEWLFVLSGSVRFQQGDTVVDLHPHDAVHLDAQVPHHLCNVTGTATSVLLVTAGSGPARVNGHNSAPPTHHEAPSTDRS